MMYPIVFIAFGICLPLTLTGYLILEIRKEPKSESIPVKRMLLISIIASLPVTIVVCIIDAAIIANPPPGEHLSPMLPLFAFITPIFVADIDFVGDLIKDSVWIFIYYTTLFFVFRLLLRQLRSSKRTWARSSLGLACLVPLGIHLLLSFIFLYLMSIGP